VEETKIHGEKCVLKSENELVLDDLKEK